MCLKPSLKTGLSKKKTKTKTKPQQQPTQLKINSEKLKAFYTWIFKLPF